MRTIAVIGLISPLLAGCFETAQERAAEEERQAQVRQASSMYVERRETPRVLSVNENAIAIYGGIPPNFQSSQQLADQSCARFGKKSVMAQTPSATSDTFLFLCVTR